MDVIKNDFPEDKLVFLEDGFLDTTSRKTIEGFKNNLKVLIDQTKKEGRVSKFMLIREDDLFPYDWKWTVSSKSTTLEKNVLPLSFELRKQIALEKNSSSNFFGNFLIPVSKEEEEKALEKVDKYTGSVFLPSFFRSTKHFTINTPLGQTGDYNLVDTNRNFIIIDSIDNFLASKYGYSVAYHDSYLDVAHEDLPISEKAIVLINKDRYPEIVKNEKIKEQLKARKVVLYDGDENLAIDMVLTENGVLPSQVGLSYAVYDEEIQNIIDDSIRNLAFCNNLLYDKNHGGSTGHFTSYYDDLNQDYNASLNEIVEYLRKVFPEYANMIKLKSLTDTNFANDLIQQVGSEKLLLALNGYNDLALEDFKKRNLAFRLNRQNITPEIRELFQNTVQLISKYYMGVQNWNYIDSNEQINQLIMQFFQSSTVEEQANAALKLQNLIQENIIKR